MDTVINIQPEIDGQDDFSPQRKLLWGVIYLALFDLISPIEVIIDDYGKDENGEKMTKAEAKECQESAKEFFADTSDNEDTPNTPLWDYMDYLGVPYGTKPSEFLELLLELLADGELKYYQSGRAVFPKMSIIPRNEE